MKYIVIVFLLQLSLFQSRAQQKEIPVVIIMADQLRYDAIGQYTPNINALKKDGVSFNRTYTASPICVPARGAFFTGKYPNTSGSLINGWVKQDERYRVVKQGTRNLYETLSKQWEAWHVGKQHFFTQPDIEKDPNVNVQWITQKTYQQWLAPQGVKKPGGREFTDYAPELVSGAYTHAKRYTVPVHKLYTPGLRYFPDDFFGEKSAEIIRNHKGKKPLMLATMFMSPHPPFHIPAPYYDKVRRQDIRIPSNVGQWYEGQSPLQLYGLAGFIGSRYSREQWEDVWPRYMGLVSLLDDETGKIIKALKDKGIYDDALIIFTADHGEMLGSHSLWMKMCMYEASARVPLVIKFPRGFRPAVSETSQPVSLIDVWPTLISYLGINGAGETDGISLMPLVEGKTFGRNDVFIQYDGNAAYGSNQRCVVSRPHKLIMDTFRDEVYLELYNVEKDPEEKENLVMKPENRALAERLIGKIKEHMRQTGDLLRLPDDVYQQFLTNYAKLNEKSESDS
ncbi:sulfatase [Chitinophaga sp. GCM10012297]|uniref:Sulfatase-like hydrolase/transferase n=1 Tax=Chitinophaga chungangae TaxID=2821488 RepID=A0ABS3YHB9_9BACT|nr:sulfatase-like hydrolase/transferase [Chitinophaga chungangae]MBO9153474.1 sulfatase-like hydrolase/transferase [Chitinophaga chungangae]